MGGWRYRYTSLQIDIVKAYNVAYYVDLIMSRFLSPCRNFTTFQNGQYGNCFTFNGTRDNVVTKAGSFHGKLQIMSHICWKVLIHGY